MDIGVVKETELFEHRVALTPAAVRQLVDEGHRVFVQQGAGDDSRYLDHEYVGAGANIAYQREEVFRRSALVLGIRTPAIHEIGWLDHGQAIAGFLHLAVAPKEIVQTILDRKVTAIGYEIIEEENGDTPILGAIGELAGHMVVHIASHLLEKESGGRGILLGGVKGLSPAAVLVIGAGKVGKTAAELLGAIGAHVVLLDRDAEKLTGIRKDLAGRIETFLADEKTVARCTPVVDVVIGAVRIAGERAPYVVTREMVSKMRPGCVIIDVAIDQGGCIETSRPTTLAHPTFLVNQVLHYCVPNLTANVPRTASKLFGTVLMPYVSEMARNGVSKTIHDSFALRKGTYVQEGTVLFPDLSARLKA